MIAILIINTVNAFIFHAWLVLAQQQQQHDTRGTTTTTETKKDKQQLCCSGRMHKWLIVNQHCSAPSVAKRESFGAPKRQKGARMV